MYRLFALFIFFTLSFPADSQSYLGWITKQVNFRESPSTDALILGSLKQGTQIFIISLDTDNNFYNIIDIDSNTEGYVHKNFVEISERVKANDQGIFTPTGNTESYNPELEIYNKTDLSLTLKLNNSTYSFSPYEKRTISLYPGSYNYRASAPGVIPDIGSEYLSSKTGYSWEFYIVTTYR
jgi:hypothetical protein